MEVLAVHTPEAVAATGVGAGPVPVADYARVLRVADVVYIHASGLETGAGALVRHIQYVVDEGQRVGSHLAVG